MAYHFSANQFEKPYSARRLHWELPKWYPPHPRARKGSTKVIADNNGHLLPVAVKWNNNPWGYFRGTYELPDKITRRFSEEYNECLLGKYKWKHFPQKKDPCGVNKILVPECKTKCETVQQVLRFDNKRKRIIHPCEKSIDLEYIPGDFTSYKDQHESRQHLLDEKYRRDNDIEPEYKLDKNYLGEENMQFTKFDEIEHKYSEPWPSSTALATPLLSPPVRDLLENELEDPPDMSFTSRRSITEKPNLRCPSPVIPAFANFELAKRMHYDNLDHQPLPDCIADLAYRKLQITGDNPGLALDIDPIATGVGLKTHNIGPTHCTKMKIFRPKTCGIVPKGLADDGLRFAGAAEKNKKMGAMDLAIGWDYRPSNPADEPRPAAHIDGSSESAGPAVFTCVKTPREDDRVGSTRGRSAGVFNNTMGEMDFFDKDIMRRKTDFTGSNIQADGHCSCGKDDCPVKPSVRASSVSRDIGDIGTMPSRYEKQYQSSPNVMTNTELMNLREKYLGPDPITTKQSCRRGFFNRSRRSCHKVAPDPSCCHIPTSFDRQLPCKGAFRVGVPRYNAAGQLMSSDSGCSMGSNHSRVLVVPRPRNPYSKRNYDIDTLVPPFRCFGGGAKEGGYPEHWRLSSVYQHAYKPMELRRRPLLQTVYK